MAKIHLVLQGKGGVGKSVISALIAQYKTSPKMQPLCIDTDPVNATFTGYKSLSVERLNLLEDDEINTRNFDQLIEIISETKHNDIIIDNGASSFVPMSHYLISNKIPALLKDMGHELIIHTVVTGGQALADTVSGFSQLIQQFPLESYFIVWLNPYWGPIEYQGKTFEKMKAYLDNKHRISAIVKLPTLKEETYGRDLSEMLQERLTFDEAIGSKDISIMTRQRLKIIKEEIFDQLKAAAF